MRLRRVCLDGVGHPDARFDPLALDFRGQSGEAMDTVIWLRNAGGKTSLLSLIFSVLQPNKSLFLGYLQKGRVKSIDRYVLSDDVSHVVLEWEAEASFPGLARPFITGVVMAQRQGAGGEDSLDRFFYALAPIEGVFGLEDLPLREDGKRLTYRKFRQRLEEIALQYPATELVIRDHQNDWMEFLERRGLDPDLFRIQLNMNRDEGGAVEILKRFTDADSFIDFLVDIVSDPQDASEVADNLAQVADKIEQRPKKEKERQFVSGAIDRLRPLAEAHAEWTRVRDLHTQILFQGSRLRRRIHLSMEVASATAAAKKSEADAQNKVAVEAERNRSTYDRNANAHQLEVFRFDIEEGRQAVDAAKRMEVEARTLVRAWQAAEIVNELNEVEAEANAKRKALARAEEDAAGIRAEYEAATMRLRIRLESLARHENQNAEHARQMAEGSHKRRQDAEQREQDARARVGQLEVELRHLDEMEATLHSKLESLVRDGLIQRGETAAMRLGSAKSNDTEKRLRLQIIPSELAEQESIRDAADAQATEGRERLAELRARHEETRRQIETFEHRAKELAQDERVLAVIGFEQVDVFVAAGVITERLISGIAEAESRLVDIQVEILEDRRAVQAINETGLLPAAIAVEQAVARLQRNFSAITGWQYLAQDMPKDSWPRILKTAPHLLDAVVVQPGKLDEAAEMLEGMSLASLTANLVVVESTEFEAVSPDEHRLWVLPPAASRYDREVGAVERQEREARLAQADDRVNHLTQMRDVDRELLLRVRTLLDECPPDHLDSLRFTLEEQRLEVLRLNERVEAEKTKATTARSTISDLDAEERRLGQELITLMGVINRLEQVARLEEDQVAWLQRQRQFINESTEMRKNQQEARQEKEDAAEHEDRWKEGYSQARNDAVAWTNKAGELPFVGIEVEELANTTLDQLEAEYRSLREQYEQRTSKSQLAKEIDGDTARAGRIRVRLQPYEDVQQHARTLLAASGAESPVHRATRLEAAQREQEAATEIRLREEAELRGLEESARKLSEDRQHLTTLPSDMRSQTREQAAQRQSENAAAVVEERSRTVAAVAARDSAAEAARTAEHEAQLLESEERQLNATLGEEATPPRAGYERIDAAEAKREVDTVVGDLRGAARAVGEQEERIRRLAQHLRGFAARDEFDELEGPHRDRMTEPEDKVLAQRAQVDLEEFERRLPFLVHQLEEIEKHQARVTEELTVLVDDAFQNLKWIQRQELPEGLGAWTGQHYFHIRYEIPETLEERKARIRVLLDEVVISKQRRITGTLLVQQALRKVNRKEHFEVSVLKPNEAFRPERASVAEIAAWSGGQKLTSAILIYCALARLRADNRREGASPVGVLLLDNPIGTANLSTLIDLQRLVAKNFGVQLIYTTALDDKPALAPFTNIIRLGNRRERRRGRGHIVQEDIDQDLNVVEGARIFSKQAASR